MSVEGRRARDGDGSVGRVFENKLADLKADFPDPEFAQQIFGKIIGQGFQKLRRLPRQKIFRVLTKGGVIDCPREAVLEIAEVARRPKSDIENEALTFRSLGPRNADVSKDFQLLDVNLLFGANSHFSEGLCFGRIIL